MASSQTAAGQVADLSILNPRIRTGACLPFSGALRRAVELIIALHPLGFVNWMSKIFDKHHLFFSSGNTWNTIGMVVYYFLYVNEGGGDAKGKPENK